MSPLRFEIMRESAKRGKRGPGGKKLKYLIPIMKGMMRSLNPIGKNPSQAKTTITAYSLKELETYLLGLGASSVGYTELPPNWIFKGKGVLHTQVIVLTQEMENEKFEVTPSEECEDAVMEIYRDLGIIANKGANLLRRRGFSCQAAHALMGVALYPPLAHRAGLGWIGKSGLLITPEHGPRVRLGAIFTGIEDLPNAQTNEHQWVEEYCEKCFICVKKCPVDAIKTERVSRSDDHPSFVDTETCFEQFADHHGCAVCIGVCPFHAKEYEKIRAEFG